MLKLNKRTMKITRYSFSNFIVDKFSQPFLIPPYSSNIEQFLVIVFNKLRPQVKIDNLVDIH